MRLRFVLLALLGKEPNTGYRLGRLLETDLAYLWDARLQQIYSELAKLEGECLLEAQVIELPNRPAKKIYSLTSKGRGALDEWLAEPAARMSSRGELLIKVFCLPHAPTESMVRRLEERRDAAESDVWHLHCRRQEWEERDDGEALGYVLAAEAAHLASEAQVAWCSWAISYLRERCPELAAADGPIRTPADRAAERRRTARRRP